MTDEVAMKMSALIASAKEDAKRLLYAGKSPIGVFCEEAVSLIKNLGDKDLRRQMKHAAILIHMLISLLNVLVEVEMDQEENPSEEG